MPRFPLPRRRPFYGWIVVGAGSAIEFTLGLVLQHVLGGYSAALTREFGWSRGAIGIGFSLSRLENGILGPAQGWLVDRFGPRAVIRAGLVILAIGFVLFSQLDSLPGFYITFGIMTVGAGISGSMPITVVVVQWFQRHRSRALGLASMGSAVGGLVAPFLIVAITTIGWRQTAIASAAVVLLVGLPLSSLIRHRPADLGLRVDGLTEEEEAGHRETDQGTRRALVTTTDFTVREAIRTPAFWLVSLGHSSAVLVVTALMVHLFLHLTDSLGYSDAQAATFIALMTFCQIVGQVVGGYLGDRVDKRVIAVVCMAVHSAMLLLIAYVGTVPAVTAFAILHGLAWGTRGPLMQALRADYFGRGSFGMIMGISASVTMIGSILGPFIAGVLFDATGSYAVGFTAIAAISLCGSLFFVFARQPAPPKRAVPAPVY